MKKLLSLKDSLINSYKKNPIKGTLLLGILLFFLGLFCAVGVNFTCQTEHTKFNLNKDKIEIDKFIKKK